MRHGFIRYLGNLNVPRILLDVTLNPMAYQLDEVSLERGSLGAKYYLSIVDTLTRASMMTDGLLPNLYLDGAKVGQPYGAIGGYGVYRAGGEYVFRSPSSGRNVIFTELRTPFAYREDGEWLGDGWYEAYPNTGSLSPMGTLLNGTPPVNRVMSYRYDGWHNANGKYGVYEGIGDMAGSQVTFGEPYWTGEGESVYARYFDYGAGLYPSVPFFSGTSKVDDRYVIGTHGSESGWWEADEPTTGAAWAFAFVLPQGSDAPTQPGITLQWGGWRAGDSRVPGGMAQGAPIV